MKRFNSPRLTAIIATSLSLVTVISQAQSTWGGGGTPNGNFSDAANWDVAPTSGGGNTLNFGGGVNLNATNDITLTSADQVINFNAGASSFTIYGGAIRGGNIANNSSVLQTILPSIRLNGTRTFNAGTGGLTLGTPVGSTSTSGRTVTKTGTGDLTIGNGTAVSGGASYSVSQGAVVFANTTAANLGTAANGVALTANGTSVKFNNSGTLSMVGAITTVSGSSVILNNSATLTVTGGTTVASGATLSGIGNLMGGAVSDSGNLTPGSIGQVRVASLILGSTATTTLDINSTAKTAAELLASGTISLGGTLIVDDLGANLQVGDTYDLFSGTISGTFASEQLPTLSAGEQWIDNTGTSGVLTIEATPEPTTWAMMIGGLGTLLALRRRKA